MKHLIATTTLALLATFGGSAIAQTPPAPSAASAYPVAPAPGLYQAFGEQAGIRALMDDFVVRLKADARIGDQFRETNLDNLAKSDLVRFVGKDGAGIKDAIMEAGSVGEAALLAFKSAVAAHSRPGDCNCCGLGSRIGPDMEQDSP